MPRTRQERGDPVSVPVTAGEGIVDPLLAEKIGRNTEGHQGDLLLGFSRRRIACHLEAGVADKEHIVPALCEISADQGLARPGGRLPVDQIDIVSEAVLPQVIEIQTPPVLQRMKVSVQKIGCLSLCI